MTRIKPILVTLGAVAATLWICGFLNFVGDIVVLREPGVGPTLENTDAIVVLTGGSERVTTGLELLESGNGKKLFISGVHRNLTLDGVLGGQPITADIRACCIALGYHASSTIGNAEETRDWMKAEGYKSLRLVTANYHMPRSLLLFRTAMPDVTILPYPVTPDSVKLYEWWQHPGTIELLVTEYSKFLVAPVRIWMNAL
ncbi:MAG: YdcF family protein [Alphaproteobacteria bacterium]